MKQVLGIVLSGSILAGCLAPVEPDMAKQAVAMEQAAVMDQGDEHIGETAQPFGLFGGLLIGLAGAAIGAAATLGAAYYNAHHQVQCPPCVCICPEPPPPPPPAPPDP